MHEPWEYELAWAVVRHSSFEELHQRVFESCPLGYACVEPIALRHEVLWSLGLTVLRDNLGNRVCERDDLVHAIEESEYSELWRKNNSPLSICVDVIRGATVMASCFGTARPAQRRFSQ